MKAKFHILFLLVGIFSVGQLACGASVQTQKVEPTLVDSLKLIDFTEWNPTDVCEVLSTNDIAEVLGHNLKNDPELFDDPTYLGKGCTYDAGQDGAEAYFAYVSLAPSPLYEDNHRAGFNVRDVNDFGLEAFTANGADAEQLWIKLSDEVALVVAIGDKPDPSSARLLAKYFLESVGGDQ